MSRKLAHKKEVKTSDFDLVMKKILEIGIKVFVVVMFLIFPFYTPNGLVNLGEAKSIFFCNWSYICFAFLLFFTVIWLIGSRKKRSWKEVLQSISLTDWFVIMYLLVTFFSYLLSNYRQDALFGFFGWRIGLVSQILFVLVYFYVSRFCNEGENLFTMMLFATGLVFLLGILHRFQVDPLGLYQGVGAPDRLKCLSTLGNTNWYCGFLCILIPLGMSCYLNAKSLGSRIYAGIFLAIAFASLVTQNSDSGFLAITAIFLVVFWFCFSDNGRMKGFLEILLIMLASFKVMGILQTFYPERTAGLDAISYFLSKSLTTWIWLFLAGALYGVFILLGKKEKINIAEWKTARNIVYVILLVMFVAVIGYIILNSKGLLPEKFGSGGFLFFNDTWGTNRGLIWRLSVGTFEQMPLYQKIIGAGPDCMDYVVKEYFTGEIENFYGSLVNFQSSHNEWLNTLLNGGILGAGTYLGIYISLFCRGMKNVDKKPYLLFLCGCIAAYVTHNFVSFQQLIGTPIIFIFMGIGENMLRKEGHKN